MLKRCTTNNFQTQMNSKITQIGSKKNLRHLCNLRLKNIKSYSSLNSASLSDCNAAFLSHSRMRKEIL